MKTEVANLIQIVNPSGDDLIVESQAQSTSYEYDEHGQRIRTTLTDGSYMLVRYDQFGRVIAESTQIAPSVTAIWSDAENSFIDDTSSEHVETKLYEYDTQGRLTAVELPAVADPQGGGALTRPRYEYEYDARGNQTVIRDPRGRETRFAYDEDGRMLSRTLPLGYGQDGIEGTADDSAVTPGEWTETFEYDEMGRQVLHISFEGVHTRTVYDGATGRMLRQEFFLDDTAYASGSGTPGEVWTYNYDAFGREVEVIQDSDGNLGTTGDQRPHRHTYDDRGRLTVVENAEGTIQYTYDNLGRKTAMKVFQAGADVLVDQPERVTSYTYDALGRLASVTEDQDPSSSSDTPLATGYKYDLRGNLDETHLPNGVIEDYVYDELNRLDTLTHYAPDETPEDLSDNDRLAEFEYTVRADGKRTAVTETYWLDENEDGTPEEHATQIDWTYDQLGRLTSESIDHFDSQFSQTEWFEYDLVGNRLTKELDSDFDGNIDEAIAYLYDANDRLTKEEKDADNNSTVDQTTTYGYDGTQQTSKTVFDNSAQANLSQSAFTYDLQGRLHTATITSFTAGDESRIERTTYDYDATGIRVSALHEIDTDANGTWDTTTRTEYLIDHQNFTGYQQVIKETIYDANGNVVKTIEYNFGHDEISQTVTEYDENGNVTSQETHIFGHDGHGSVKVLYDAAAAILQAYTYEAYGQMLAIHNAIAAVVTTGALTSLQYSGEQFDSRIDQQYLRARYYDPNSGRFNRLDPFAGNSQDPQSFHKYLYAQGDPIAHIDPSGLMALGSTLSVSGISSRMRAMQMPTFARAFEFSAGIAMRAGGWASARMTAWWPSILDTIKWMWFPTGSRYALSGSLSVWLGATAKTFAARWGFSFAQGLLTNTILQWNINPVISSLRQLATTAAGFNGSLGWPVNQGLAAATNLAADKIQAIMDQMLFDNLATKPVTWGQVGAAGNTVIALQNAYKFQVQLGLLNESINNIVLAAYNGLPAQAQATIDAELGLPQGLQSVDFYPSSANIVTSAFFLTLDAHEEIDYLRRILIMADGGNFRGAGIDLLALLKNMKGKYGDVYVNGKPL